MSHTAKQRGEGEPADTQVRSDIKPSGSPALHNLLMPLQHSVLRDELSRLREAAHQAVYFILTPTVNPNSLMDDIGQRSGIEIVERRDCWQDKNRCHCAEWVFAEQLGFNIQGDREFWDSVIGKLEMLGFVPTATPQTHDIAVYGFRDPRGLRGKHIGLFQRRGRIRSKFEMGHVFEHGLDAVPSDYGDSILFFHGHRAPAVR
jgi:hypothetical protein